MAKNRQKAKQRQAERRARREEQGGDDTPPVEDPRAPEPSPAIDPYLAAGAPPEDEGQSQRVARDEPDVDELDDDVDPELIADAEEAGALEGEPPLDETEGIAPPRGRHGGDESVVAEAKNRPRFVQFLIAVWAELQRVQWPNRQALTTLTGVVLGFVLLAGGYLGLIDVIFSELVKAII